MAKIYTNSLSPLLYLTRSNYFPGPGTRELEETSVSRSVIYQAGETANLPCDISLPNKQNDELMLIMWYREDVRSPIYSIGKNFLVLFILIISSKIFLTKFQLGIYKNGCQAL